MERIAIMLTVLSVAFSSAGASSRRERISRAARALRAKLVELRRDFHMHPELSNREVRTARVVAERLRALGFDEVKTGVAKHGVVALLKGGKPGPAVAWRADMDALPIDETLDVPYKSRTPGVKHACGHDVHMTVALGAAEVLAGMRAEIPGTVKMLFQPAEEGPPEGEEGGAPRMIREGALENPRPLAIFGLHVNPSIAAGRVGWAAGPFLASADHLFVTIRGKKAHGAYPHQGVDTVLVAAEAVVALQSIRSRRIDPTVPFVLTIGSVQGGNRFNILAEEVKMEGTVRTLDEKVRERAHALIREILAGVTAAHGASFEMRWGHSNPVTFNDPALTERMVPTMKAVLGEANVLAWQPRMGGEDFSYYQKVLPGMYFWLGVGNEARGIRAKLHTPDFDADEESLVVGAGLAANLLLDFLEQQAGK
jgi:amidohydrolase